MEMEGSGRQRGSGAASGPLCFWTVARTKRQTHHKWLFLLMSLQRAVIGRNDNTKKPQRSAHGGRPQVLGGTTRALRTTRDRTRRCLNDGPLRRSHLADRCTSRCVSLTLSSAGKHESRANSRCSLPPTSAQPDHPHSETPRSSRGRDGKPKPRERDVRMG
uniref:Uncharacterized protein n=1 Tax=Knipowitschia caucasica TaxID=637954 RepID=A0AAV2KEW6_KNICA